MDKMDKEEKNKNKKCNDRYNTLIVIFCIIFLITILFIEFKDYTKDYSYQQDVKSSQEELDKINWSGDYNDLKYCFIFIDNNGSYNNSFHFTWLKECELIYQDCVSNNNCYFEVGRNQEYIYQTGNWRQTFRGKCYCDVK